MSVWTNRTALIQPRQQSTMDRLLRHWFPSNWWSGTSYNPDKMTRMHLKPTPPSPFLFHGRLEGRIYPLQPGFWNTGPDGVGRSIPIADFSRRLCEPVSRRPRQTVPVLFNPPSPRPLLVQWIIQQGSGAKGAGMEPRVDLDHKLISLLIVFCTNVFLLRNFLSLSSCRSYVSFIFCVLSESVPVM